MNWKKRAIMLICSGAGLLFLLLIALTAMAATSDHLSSFSMDLLPGIDSFYDVGSTLKYWDNGYFRNINGAPYSGSTQWTTDANGIHYDAGNVGFNTDSVANQLVKMYSNDGTSNNPVLYVGDNSAGAGATGIEVSMVGAKTDDNYGIKIQNASTSNTALKDKFGLYISSSSVWNGAGSTNYGLYIDTPAGGTLNIGAFIDGTTDLSDNNLNNVNKLNMTDPSELTINAGAITVTQGFHTVDTQADASSDYLDTINGGTVGDILTIAGANDAREVIITRNGNVRFQPEHMIEGFSFASPSGASGTFYTGGYYAAPAADANLNQGSLTVTYGTANSPYGAHAFLVAGGAGATDAGTVSIVVSGSSIANDGTLTAVDSETIVSDITTMAQNNYYQTTKSWVGTVTYTLTPAGGASNFNADFNYGRAAYDSFDERLHTAKLFEVMGRAGANDTGFDIQLLHHKSTGWTYSAAAFVPGTTPICSLATDYGANNDLVAGERFKYEREVNVNVNGLNGLEGLLVRVVTTANKAVEFMDVSIYVEAIPNDQHLKNTNQSLKLIYNGTNWMKQ